MDRISPEVRRHPDSEVGTVHRLDRLSRLLMLGMAVEAAAAIAAIISMGGGHGTMAIATLCFPYSIALLPFIGDSATPVLLLALFQFPAYALLGWLLEPPKRWDGWVVLAVIHGVAVAAAFVLSASRFTP